MAVETREFLFANFARSTLAAALSASATTLTLVAGQRFPAPDYTGQQIFAVILSDATGIEILYCTARDGNVLTVERGAEGTTARSWPADTAAVHGATAGFLDQLAAVVPPSFVVEDSIDVTVYSSVDPGVFEFWGADLGGGVIDPTTFGGQPNVYAVGIQIEFDPASSIFVIAFDNPASASAFLAAHAGKIVRALTGSTPVDFAVDDATLGPDNIQWPSAINIWASSVGQVRAVQLGTLE